MDLLFGSAQSVWTRPSQPLNQILDVANVGLVHVRQRLPPEHQVPCCQAAKLYIYMYMYIYMCVFIST